MLGAMKQGEGVSSNPYQSYYITQIGYGQNLSLALGTAYEDDGGITNTSYQRYFPIINSLLSQLTVTRLNSSGSVNTYANCSILNLSFTNPPDSGISYYVSGNVYGAVTSSFVTQFTNKINTSSGNNFNATAIDTMPNGNVILGGFEVIGATFETITPTVVVADNLGNIQWSRYFDGVGSINVEIVAGVTSDSSNNVYAIVTVFNYEVMGIVKWNSAGTLQWQKVITGYGSNGVSMLDIAVDSSGNSYSIGYTGANTGIIQYFIIKFDSSGSLVWQKYISNAAVTEIQIVNNIIYLIGYGSSSQYSTVTSFDLNGNALWTNQLTSSNVNPIYTSTSSLSVKGLSIVNSGLYVGIELLERPTGGSQISNALTMCMPANGAGTSNYTINNLNLNYATASNISTSSGNLTISTGNLVTGSNTFTNSTTTTTTWTLNNNAYNVTSIPAVI